jgi:hypothetical protein
MPSERLKVTKECLTDFFSHLLLRENSSARTLLRAWTISDWDAELHSGSSFSFSSHGYKQLLHQYVEYTDFHIPINSYADSNHCILEPSGFSTFLEIEDVGEALPGHQPVQFAGFDFLQADFHRSHAEALQRTPFQTPREPTVEAIEVNDSQYDLSSSTTTPPLIADDAPTLPPLQDMPISGPDALNQSLQNTSIHQKRRIERIYRCNQKSCRDCFTHESELK